MKKIVVFASGSGSNFEAIQQAILNKKINAKIELVVCDKQKAFVLQRAINHNIESLYVNLKKCGSKEVYEQIIVDKLDEIKPDLICLAGYMKRIDKTILNKYEGKIINIHPALLPSFKGAHGISDAFNYGCRVFGVTVHYVNENFDEGKIIMQRAFEYNGSDINEVEEMIHKIEHVLYVESINKII